MKWRKVHAAFVNSVIEQPAEVIFDLLADIRRNPAWCPGFTRAEKLTAAPVGPMPRSERACGAWATSGHGALGKRFRQGLRRSLGARESAR